MSDIDIVRQKYEMLRAAMDERMCRLWAASEAIALGWGGVTLVAKATGISRPRICAGIREFEQLGLIPMTPVTPPRYGPGRIVCYGGTASACQVADGRRPRSKTRPS
jgi:hypothetical protein